MTQSIRLDDRISAVLARDPRMLGVLLSASPTFSHLRNPLVRKTMAKLATVEQAARVAGIDAHELVERLNRALAGEPLPSDPVRRSSALTPPENSARPCPAPEDKIIECDVRDELRAGHEPLKTIIAAAARVAPDGALRLRAIFEPVPLYHVLGRQGFQHFAERLGDEDWCVYFWRGAAPRQETAVLPAGVATPLAGEPNTVVLDVRGLEPPEPLVRTLVALESLPRGATLVQINERVPQFLLPRLHERGFSHEIAESSPELVRIVIRHANS